MKLWSFADDWPETMLLIMGLVVGYWAWFGWVSAVSLLVILLAIGRLVTQVIGRAQLRRRTKYVTRDGLIVVGDRVPKREYVDKMVADVVEWCCDDFSVFPRDQIHGVFEGVVIECVDPPFANWSLANCPWPLLPWDDGKWIRVGLNQDGRAPALPFELMSRIMFHAGNYRDPEIRQMAMDDLGFDLNG